MNLEELFREVHKLSPDKLNQLDTQVWELTADKKFIPSPGPQFQAYHSKADILLYGGEPGGGKTGLLIGLALNEHNRSLIVRKQFTDVEGIVDNAKGIVGADENFVGGTRPKFNKPDGGVIHFEGMASEGIDTSKQGTPHDFIGVDEAAQLPLVAVMMLIGWNRTNKPGQRCRMVLASNPPVDTVGDWLGEFFAPWLDPAYPNPARPGELRWFIIDQDNKSREVPGSQPVTIDGQTFYPHSRSYIPAGLKDNPYIDATEYRKRQQAMPEPYRSILLSGNFLAARRDDELQLIPTAWIRAAQKRWQARPPEGIPMCAIAADIAQGGDDNTVLAARYDSWFAPLIVVPGRQTPTGAEVAGLILSHRRDGAKVIVDMGGGYGGATLEHLKANIPAELVFPYRGGESAKGRSGDGGYGFFNQRAEAWWKLREALDPSQPQGSTLALPDDPMLLSDLASVRLKQREIGSRGIQIESKEDLVKRLGRSPDRGDAVVMCWFRGARIATHYEAWKARNTMPRVNLGHDLARSQRR